MTYYRPRLFRTAGLAIGFLGLEALCLVPVQKNIATGWAVTFFFQIAAGSMVLALCIRRARRAIVLQFQWLLLATCAALYTLSFLLRGCSYLLSAVAGHSVSSQLNYTDLLMALNIVPAVMLLSLPSGKPYLRSFLLIDAAQILMIGYLAFIKFYAVIPFTYTELHPVSVHTLIVYYNLQEVTLFVIVGLRYLAAPSQDEKRFYRFYVLYTFGSGICIMIYNYLAGEIPYYGSYYDLLAVAPLPLFIILARHLPAESVETAKVRSDNPLADYLNIASPTFFTIVLLVFSIDAAQRFFVFGGSMIAVAFLLHSIRGSVLQKHFESTQKSLEQARDLLEELSMTDPLTEVANRRSFDQALQAEWVRAERSSKPLSLLMMDIDYFKALNDRYGHQAGDRCLVRVAHALGRAVRRRGDLLARYGGEEFALILPRTDRRGAYRIAARMQRAVNRLKVENATPIGRHATMSIGVATMTASRNDGSHELVESADRALYRAKNLGRNRIARDVASDGETPATQSLANRSR